MKQISISTLLFSMFLFTGCSFFQASNTGQGTTFQYGKMEGFLKSSLSKVHSATGRAIKDLELLTASAKKDALFSSYEARNAKDEKVTISIEKIGSDSVKVYIKVGLLGDQMYSQAIFDAIRKHL